MINETTKYIIDRFGTDDMVHTISLSDNGIVDVKKENIYPVIDIFFLNRSETDEQYSYVYKIHVLQQRNIKREMTPGKIMSDTNYLDNLADCESIINNFVNYVRRFDIDSNYTLQTTSLQRLSNYGGAGLDGFTFELTLSTPNTGYCNTL